MKRLGFNVGVEYFSATRTDFQQFLMGDGHWVLRNRERILDRGAVDIGTKPNRPRLQINRRLSRRQRPIAGGDWNLTNLYNRNGSRRSTTSSKKEGDVGRSKLMRLPHGSK